MNQTTTQQTRVEEQLNKIVNLFSSKELVGNLRRVYLTAQGKPMEKWSFGNQFAALSEGTTDARGFNQWKQVGRYVKKGSKAIYILGPSMVNVVKEDDKGELESFKVLKGFHGIPVFKVEDTEGKEVSYVKEDCKLPKLAEVAQRWGATINFQGTIRGEYGSYNPSTHEISLSTKDEDVFFHELVHFAQGKLFGDLTADKTSPKYKENEVIAQLGACVLASMYGLDVSGFSYGYISGYVGDKKPEVVGRACVQVLSKVGKILNYILKTEQELNGGEVSVK